MRPKSLLLLAGVALALAGTGLTTAGATARAEPTAKDALDALEFFRIRVKALIDDITKGKEPPTEAEIKEAAEKFGKRKISLMGRDLPRIHGASFGIYYLYLEGLDKLVLGAKQHLADGKRELSAGALEDVAKEARKLDRALRNNGKDVPEEVHDRLKTIGEKAGKLAKDVRRGLKPATLKDDFAKLQELIDGFIEGLPEVLGVSFHKYYSHLFEIDRSLNVLYSNPGTHTLAQLRLVYFHLGQLHGEIYAVTPAIGLYPILARFVENEGATHYTVQVYRPKESDLKVTYAWKLSLELVDRGDPKAMVDPACNNGGKLASTEREFVWTHLACEHTKEGRSGHQGKISVVVSAGRWHCTATFSGSNSNGGPEPPPCVKR